jgi:integrase/recombinase XerD
MKPKVVLKRIFHRNAWRYAIVFQYDKKLTSLVRSVNNATWSQTHSCWYANEDESTLKQILTVFRDSADINISEIVTRDNENAAISVPHADADGDSRNAIKEEKKLTGKSIKKVQNAERYTEYDPVIFTINDSDGRLVIKFTGRYEKDWIRELSGFGKPSYDGIRKEWYLKWSQLAVDSLSDYFTNRGVEVIVKKGIVPIVLKEMRDETGTEIRSRKLSDEALTRLEIMRQYLDEKRYSKRTIEAYLEHLELFFKYFYDREPDEISTKDISGFIDDFILRLGYSASYQNIVISSIKIYFAISGGRKVGSDSFERPRKSRALPKVFSKEEVMKIFSATRNSKHKLMLWLIYSCGLRRSEVINIKLNDLDFERGILNIRKGKGNVDRMVPIPQKVWEKIGEYRKSYRPVTYLFEGQKGGIYSVESVYSVFKQSMKRAGIHKDVGVHSLRHSYATHLHENGLDIRYIQELLGHKSSRTTEIYTHVSRRNLLAIRSPIEDMDIG